MSAKYKVRNERDVSNWKRIKPYAIIVVSILVINGLYENRTLLLEKISNFASESENAFVHERAEEPNNRYEVFVQTDGANIRSSPNLSADIITAVSRGESLFVLNETVDEEGREWLRVELKSGKEGWVSGKIVAK